MAKRRITEGCFTALLLLAITACSPPVMLRAIATETPNLETVVEMRSPLKFRGFNHDLHHSRCDRRRQPA
ncbi:hypothetical protein [Oscillatoria acuminata]|uniref:hypothetical protein n=1 Tax=Oscillatoria acuminata TaxID=118323 RepID=UPI0018DB6844|nr:hypothetical protein [Oscillatoria acuminata]